MMIIVSLSVCVFLLSPSLTPCVCVRVCVRMYVEAKGHLGCHFSRLFHFVFVTGSITGTQGSLIWLGYWPANPRDPPACICLNSAGGLSLYHYDCFIMGLWEYEHRSSCWYGKLLTNGARAPAPQHLDLSVLYTQHQFLRDSGKQGTSQGSLGKQC